MFTDFFNDDAFSLIALTAAINENDHVPGRAGTLAFAGAGEGVAVTTISIEKKATSLSLIQTSTRGGPAPKETQDKANIRAFNIPHVKLEDVVRADQVMGVRDFGSTDQLKSVQTAVNGQLSKMSLRHDLTLEHLRLGALKGLIKDADGSTIYNLFTEFGVSEKTIDFGLSGSSSSDDIRVKCQEVSRYIARHAKTVLPSTARGWVFCGDNFFDALISRSDVKAVFTNTDEQRARLGGNYAFGAFEFGGLVFENYRGTDDGENSEGTVGIDPDEARVFLTGVPGLYAEYYAPADFMETVNTRGLPRYAKLAPDQKYNQFVELHTQQNPLPLCLRPQTLVKLTV